MVVESSHQALGSYVSIGILNDCGDFVPVNPFLTWQVQKDPDQSENTPLEDVGGSKNRRVRR